MGTAFTDRVRGTPADAWIHGPPTTDFHLRLKDIFIVDDSCRFARLYHLNGGILDDTRILAESTVREMLSIQRTDGERAQGLTWYAHRLGDAWAWGHGGSDPGVNNDIRMLPEQGLGAIVLTNTNGIRPNEFTDRMLEEALGK